MRIVVLSCDKNEDIFYAFHHCMEKYWKNHPEIIYLTESVKNPYYKTICKDYPLDKWTRRIRESLEEIDDNEVLIMIDDLFIREPVDVERINYAKEHLKDNIAMFNFEKSFDKNDIETNIDGFKLRQKGSWFELSIMCGLWQKDKLINILEGERDPWSVEEKPNTKGYDYYINGGDYIINWGYEYFKPCGLNKGKWTHNIIDFFEKEGIDIDYGRRGFKD